MLDELIIGQGLAGSLLAWRLIRAGRRVLVIDDGDRDSASHVAAGLVNPLAGRRLRLPADAPSALEAARACWTRLERQFGQRFYHPLAMLRLFQDDEQAARYPALRTAAATRPFVGPRLLRNRRAGFVQRHAGWLDTTALLDQLGGWLAARGALRRTRCAATEFRPTARHVAWRGLRARQVVFCEGWRLRDNPWFNWLPLQPAKGEILDLAHDAPLPELILNGGCWAIPQGDGRLRFGASNSWHFADARPEPTARAWLLERHHELFPDAAPPRLLAQRAGIRPGTSDRQPLIGRHPRHPRLLACNGFGARGALFMPLYTEALSRHLRDGRALPAAIDIARHARRLDARG